MPDISANREYKDSVFTWLFKEKEKLVSLYNALSGSNLPPNTDVEIATLTNVLYNSWRNDIAFVIEGRLVILIEHQSTINENMPLRFFMYIAKVYEKLIDDRKLYHSKLIKIPKPDFIVLYNGTAPFPEEKRLRLSDAFINVPGAIEPSGSLELEVRVVNINEGNNKAIVNRCEELYGYTKLVGKITKYRAEGLSLEEEIGKAVLECIDENILAVFLKAHASEVINMLVQIYNPEIEKQVIREEAWEEGHEEGLEKGREEGLLNAAEKFLTFGIDAETISKLLAIPKSKFLTQED